MVGLWQRSDDLHDMKYDPCTIQYDDWMSRGPQAEGAIVSAVIICRICRHGSLMHVR
jgi:hypothetical protein